MKKIVFTFGRMNPPTIGHAKLVDRVVAIAKSKHADHRIYVSQSQDSRKNPLPFTDKVNLLRKIFPRVNFPMESSAKTIFHVMTNITKEGYDDVTLVVGADRVGEFRNVIGKYVKSKDDPKFDPGKHYDIKFDVISAGARDPDAEGVEGMSASKMRNFVKDGDIDSFISGFPVKNVSLARKTFATIKRHLKEDMEPFAIFVSGGPASGKDLIVRDLAESLNIKEIAPENLSGTVTQNLIINGHPDDFSRPKMYLEDLGYSTAYINVSIDDSVSQERNIFRSRPLTEEKRFEKLSAYNRAAKSTSKLFEVTYTFNNSVDYKNDPEYIREQLHEMKSTINEKLLNNLKDWMQGVKSPVKMQKALQAYFMAVDKHSYKKGMSKEAVAGEVALDYGLKPHEFTNWIVKNSKILGIDRKYQLFEDINDQFADEVLDEEGGAGYWGTPELTKRYASMTPGQEKFKLPPAEGDKYNEPRAKVYGTYVGGPKGRFKKKIAINEAVGQYADERTARKMAYDSAMTQVDPWTTLHVVQHKDGTYTVMLDMNLKTKARPGDKSVASYTSSSVKDGTQKDPSSVPKTFQQFIGNKGINY